MTRWEYLRYPVILGRGGPDVGALSNSIGYEGWELVCFVPDDPKDGAVGYLLFKRPSPEAQQRRP